MNLFSPFDDDFFPTHSLESTVNPANGLPMIEGSCIDVMGNPFGFDSATSDCDSLCSGDFGMGCGFGSLFDD